MSLDGYIDAASGDRLMLSSKEDFERRDSVRAQCDAILVGAGTLRADNPKLLSKSSRPLIKVTLTQSDTIDLKSNFFTIGSDKKLVYCPDRKVKKLQMKIADLAEVVGGGAKQVDLRFMLSDLERRGIKKLMVEGGSQIGTLFLQQGLTDELQLSIAPFFVGQKNAVRFVGPGTFFNDLNNRMNLVSVEKLGDTALLTYYLKR